MRCYWFVSLLALSFVCYSQEYAPLDREGSVIFSIRNFGLSVEGELRGLDGQIVFDPVHPEKSNFFISLNASTINTGIELRNNHLKKEEYLDVENHPTIQFSSTELKRGQSNSWLLYGKLTIKDHNVAILIPFEIEEKETPLFRGKFKINRRDFDVGGRSIGMADSLTVYLRVMVSQKVKK